MRNKRLIALLIVSLLIFSAVVIPRDVVHNVAFAGQGNPFDDGEVLPARGEQWINFTINFYNKELPKYLPKDVKFKVVRSDDGEGVAILMTTPKNYTVKDMMYLDSLQHKIDNNLKMAWREESKKIIKQRQNEAISPKSSTHSYYHLSGTEYHYYYYQTALGTSVDTDVNWYYYGLDRKATMQGSSTVWVTDPMEGYKNLKLEIELHLWGASISTIYPPSSSLSEAIKTYSISCSAPITRAILNFPIWTRYALAFYRAGQDQDGYITYNCGGTQITDSVHIYRGCNLPDNPIS